MDAASFRARTVEDQEAYLRLFGYLDPTDAGKSSGSSGAFFTEAVRRFQRKAGLQQTGTVDEDTRRMMEMPRCGVPDTSSVDHRNGIRRKRFALQGTKWYKRSLSYRINSYPFQPNKDIVDEDIKYALNLWSEASPLTFTKVDSRNARVDIEIDFVKFYHGDGISFDGPGGILAHAFFPGSGGDVHFDVDEPWTSRSYHGANLLQVAIHELGHSLGLSHSDNLASAMAPFYRKWEPQIQLHADDIAGIRHLYGARRTDHGLTRPADDWQTQMPTKRPPLPGTLCANATLDAIFAINDYVYAFQGHLFYLFYRLRIVENFPMPIGDAWPGLPYDIDAAFYWPHDQTTSYSGVVYFFKDSDLWRFDVYRRPLGKNPQPISKEFRGLPSGIDAAFVWGRNDKLYFFKGDQYYRYTEGLGIDPKYPQSMKIWKGLPDRIDAAFLHTNGKTYFFSGEEYYRFDDNLIRADPRYPKPTASAWFGCPTLPAKTTDSPGENEG